MIYEDEFINELRETIVSQNKEFYNHPRSDFNKSNHIIKYFLNKYGLNEQNFNHCEYDDEDESEEEKYRKKISKKKSLLILGGGRGSGKSSFLKFIRDNYYSILPPSFPYKLQGYYRKELRRLPIVININHLVSLLNPSADIDALLYEEQEEEEEFCNPNIENEKKKNRASSFIHSSFFTPYKIQREAELIAEILIYLCVNLEKNIILEGGIGSTSKTLNIVRELKEMTSFYEVSFVHCQLVEENFEKENKENSNNFSLKGLENYFWKSINCGKKYIICKETIEEEKVKLKNFLIFLFSLLNFFFFRILYLG